MSVQSEGTLKSSLASNIGAKVKKKRKINQRQIMLLLILAPAVIWFIVFKFIPMAGTLYAFTNMGRARDVSFVGIDNFVRLFHTPAFFRAFKNTLIISLLMISVGFPIPIILALLINEVNNKFFKKYVQFMTYIPHFFSWVVVGSIFFMLLSPSDGIVNAILMKLGMEDSIFFMASNKWFRVTLVLIETWKSSGYAAVIYIAALAGIDKQLYEAAQMDGANHWHKVIYITLPGLRNTIMTVLLLSVARVLLVFEQIFILYNSSVYETADVLQTYIYRVGLISGDMGFATAVGLFTSVISAILVIGCNLASKKFFDEGII